MRIVRPSVIAGFVIWAAATAVLIPLGHTLFGPDDRVPAPFWAGLIVVATFFGVYWLAGEIPRRAGATSFAEGALVGAFACLPGLVLDGALYAVNGGRYPGLDAAASGVMSSTLLFAYAAALLAAAHASFKHAT